MQKIEQTVKSYRAIVDQWEENLKKGRPYNAEPVRRRKTKNADASESSEKNDFDKAKEKIKELRGFLNHLENTAKDDPGSIETVNLMLNRMSDVKNNEPTEEETILAMIEKGESQTVEFKQTIKLPEEKDGTPKEYTNKQELVGIENKLQTKVLINIVAFLNTDGGNIFVGVNDDKKIIGIENEEKHYGWSDDKYLRHISNLVRDHIGLEFASFIKPGLVKITGKKIIKIECKQSLEACYLNNESFYIKHGPTTEELKGPEILEHIKHHFK